MPSKKNSKNTDTSSDKNTFYCSFCGKSQHEVRKLIAGPTVFICDECVELCMDIIKEENKSISSLIPELGEGDNVDILREIFLDGLAKVAPGNAELCNSLAEYFLVLATKSRSLRRNLFLVGPDGCNAGLLAEAACRLVGLPVIRIDGATLRPTSLIQSKELLLSLLQACDYNVERAQRGVVIIENIDRVIENTSDRQLRQEELDILVRGFITPVTPEGGRKHPQQEFLQIDTSGITFIAISHILHKSEAAVIEDNDFNRIQPKTKDQIHSDLVAANFIPRFCDAFDELIEFKPISKKDVLKFIGQEDSRTRKGFTEEFSKQKVEFSKSAFDWIVQDLIARKAGLGRLDSTMNAIAMRVSFRALANPNSKEHVEITDNWLSDNF